MNDASDRSAPALVGDLLSSVSELFRKEIQLFRAELSEKTTQAVVAIGSIAAGLVVGLTALNVLAAALVVAIERAGVPAGWSALIVGGALAIIAFFLARGGMAALQGGQPRPGAHRPRGVARRRHGQGENVMSIATSTDPGAQSAAELEREVDRERERVSDTIGALQSKLSMDSVVEQVARAVSEHGGEVGRNLGRALRDNPLPAILTGVGLVWLMAGSGSRSRYDEDWDDRPPEPYYPREPARTDLGTPPADLALTYDEDRSRTSERRTRRRRGRRAMVPASASGRRSWERRRPTPPAAPTPRRATR